MDVDLSFVVDGAAPVEEAITRFGLEGRRLPRIERVDGLHVVMAVDEERGFAGRVEPFGVDGGVAARRQHHRAIRPRLPERMHEVPRARGHVACVLGQARNRRDFHPIDQLAHETLALPVDVFDDLLHGANP